MPAFGHVALDLALGAVIGALGGLFGLGGGLLAIPILGVLFGFDEQHAQGTSMVLVLPNVLVGLWQYARRSVLDPRIAVSLAASAIPFTLLGAHLATRQISSATLRYAFAGFLTLVTCYLIARWLRDRAHARAGRVRHRKLIPWPFATLVGAFGGLLSGVFSVGGALFAVPAVTLMFGLSQAAAQGMGLALVAPGTFVSVATYALAGDVVWPTGIPLAIGGVLAVPAGVALAHRIPDRTLKLLFCALLGSSAIALAVKG